MFYEKIDELNEALSVNYLSQVITIRGKPYVFGPPTTPAEERQQERQRKKVIGILIKDAALVLAKESLRDFYSNNAIDSTVFNTIDALIENIPSREEVQSPIATQSYEEIKLEHKKQVGLDYDSYQVKMQDPRLEMPNDGE